MVYSSSGNTWTFSSKVVHNLDSTSLFLFAHNMSIFSMYIIFKIILSTLCAHNFLYLFENFNVHNFFNAVYFERT